jgi:hypothetical protein
MKIVNISSFLEFAEEMQTRYKFYRVVGDKMQLFMVGRDGLILYSIADMRLKQDIIRRGFLETELTKDEIALMGLE